MYVLLFVTISTVNMVIHELYMMDAINIEFPRPHAFLLVYNRKRDDKITHVLYCWWMIYLYLYILYIYAGLQGFEMMAIAAVGNNLITYVLNEMHFSLSKSANIVTNFIGTVFLLSLFGGYLSDSYLGSFWTMIIFGFVELSVSRIFFFFAFTAHNL